MNWSIAFLLAAPNALKGADTKKKQAALFKHLSEYEYTEVEGEVRLVQRKDVYHDQAKFAEAFWEVRSAINKGGPLDSDRLVYLVVLFMAKFPGLTLGDFAALLLKSPDLTDREKTLGEYLKSMDDRAGKMWRQEGPSKIGMDVGLLGLFRDAMRRSLEEQEKRYVSEEERDAYKAMVSMATGTLPPGTDLRSYLGFMINMIKNLTNALAVDDGVLSPHEKDVIEGLSKYIVLLEKVRVEDSKRAQRVKEEDVRIDLPIGLAQNDDGEWVVRETLTPQVDPNLLSSIDQQTRTKVIPQLLKYSELSDEIFGEIAEDVNVKASTVKVLASYLKTDPASRDELKAMGYSNSLLPGWVYVNSGDKFVEPPPARAQR
jgi:hypothetical protein